MDGLIQSSINKIKKFANTAFNTKFMPGQQMTVNQAIGRATQNFSQDFGNVLRGTHGIQGQQLQNPIIPKIPLVSNFAQMSGNTGQSVATGMGGMYRGGNNMIQGIQQGNPLKFGQGLVNTGFGAAQIASAGTPLFTGANLLSQSGGSLTNRIGKGLMQGQTGINGLAPNVKENKIDIFGMKVDPIVGASSLVGFTKNPVWAKIFGKTAKLAEYGLKGIALKGGVEGLIQGMDQLPDNPTKQDITNILLTNIAMGTGAEVGTSIVGNVFKKINGSAIVTEMKSKMLSPYSKDIVETMQGPMPRWKAMWKQTMGENVYGPRTPEVGIAENSIELPKNNLVEPKVKVINGKVKVKMEKVPVKQSMLNEQSGLPPEGLPGQPQQKKNIASHLYSRFLGESRSELKKMGSAGQSMADRIDNMYTEAQRKAGGTVADLKQVVGNMDDLQNEQLIQGLRNGEKTPQVEQVRKVLDKVYQDAKKVGLDIGYKENYAPQMVDMNKLKLNRDNAIQYFVETKQFSSLDKATQFIDDIISGTDIRDAYNRFGKPMPKKMGNLEFQRILDWIPDVLRTDKKLLPDYIEQAYSRIQQVKQFGKNGEIGTNLLQNISKQGHDVKLAQQIYDQNLGLVRYDKIAQKTSGLIRSAQGAMKLPLAAITNATQSVNTASKYGVKRTLGQIYKYANPANRAAMDDFALRTGATLNGEMQRVLDEYTASGNNKSVLQKLIAPFFGKVENFNRRIAANVGKDFAESQGVKGTEALLKAGQEAVDTTQFQVRPIDMPVSWNTPAGKVATQFKSFGFRQSNFVKKELIDKVAKGDLMPLTRFILVGTVVNEIANNIKSVINRKDRPEDIVQRIIEDVPGVGYYQDAVEAIAYGLKVNKLPEAIFDFVAGPTGADARKFIANTGSAINGNFKPLAKETIASIPFVGRPFVNENKQLFTSQRNTSTSLQGTQTSPTEPTIPTPNGEPTLLDKQRLSDQISELEKQKKAVYDQSGVNLLGNNFGTMSDQEKIQKMNVLETTITQLKDQQKVMNQTKEQKAAEEYSYTNAQYSLNAQRLKQAEDYNGWIGATEKQITSLIDYQSTLDPVKDKTKIVSLQNTIEDLTTSLNKYKGYGGFSKPKKGSSIAKVSAGRVARARAPKSMKVGTIKSPKLKALKKSTFKVSKGKRARIKVKMPKLPKFG